MEGTLADTLLEVKDLRTYFRTEEGVVKAVDGISFELGRGKTLGIVGESGCGKSVTSLSIMRLIPNPPGKIVGGGIFFEGEDLLAKSEKQMRGIRGNSISMIFQEPMTSLNPIMTVGSADRGSHPSAPGYRARGRQEKASRCSPVGHPYARKKTPGFLPHQLSGGMRQRVISRWPFRATRAPHRRRAHHRARFHHNAQIIDLMKKMRRSLAPPSSSSPTTWALSPAWPTM